jgi:hypothetical protein
MNKKELVLVLTITFIVIMAWVIFDILHSKSSEPIDPKIQELLTPIESDINKTLIQKINQNIAQENQATIFQEEPKPLPIPVKTATPPATPQPIVETDNTATESANLDNTINQP